MIAKADSVQENNIYMHGLLQFCALRGKRLQICVCPIMQSISGRIHEKLLPTGYTSQFEPCQLVEFKKSKKVQADVQVGPHWRGMKRMPLMMFSWSKMLGVLGAVNRGAQADEPPRSQSHTEEVGTQAAGAANTGFPSLLLSGLGTPTWARFHPVTARFIVC